MSAEGAGNVNAGSSRPARSARQPHLYLVGFMGAGKTSVGRRLAELLGRTFFDLDDEIEKRAGKPIVEIFRECGERHFRSLERRELVRISRGNRTVIAVGGGAFCSAENRETMSRSGISIWLDAPLELLFDRCSADPTVRPLFAGAEEMKKLLIRRVRSYARAKVRVPVGNLSVDELARQILVEIGEVPDTGRRRARR